MKFLTVFLFFTFSANYLFAQKQNWIGYWERSSWQNNATLQITFLKRNIIKFHLIALSGGHTGDIEGKASIIGNIAKYYKVENLDTCVLRFTLKSKAILVTQGKGECFAAMGVYFSGSYNSKSPKIKKEQSETLYHLGIIKSKKDDSLFRKLVKNDYNLFLNSTQLTSEDEDLDNLNSKVFSSGVRGLYTLMENILMINSKKEIWAAVIDIRGKKEKVLYFTNQKDYIDRLPKTIDNWRTNFKQYPVIYMSK